MPLPLEDLQALQGRPLYAANGDKIGGIEEIYCDRATNEPEWIGINAGFLGTKRIVVPVAGARIADDGLWVPYASDIVKDAPGVDARELTEEAESLLYSHYGIGYSRDASPSGLPTGTTLDNADEVTLAGDVPPDGTMVDDDDAAREAASSSRVSAGDTAPLQDEAARPNDAPGLPDMADIVMASAPIPGLVSTTHPAVDLQAPLVPDPSQIQVPAAPHQNGTHSFVAAETAPLPTELGRPSAHTGGARAFVRDMPGRRLLAGAAAGAVATLPMAAAMFAMHRLLPRPEQETVPPREITMHVAEHAGVRTSEINERGRRVLTTAAHYGFGAASGAVYAVTAGRAKGHPALSDGLFGLGLWAIAYLRALPALRLFPEAAQQSRKRNALMIAAHAVWGIAAGLVFRRLSVPASSAKAR